MFRSVTRARGILTNNYPRGAVAAALALLFLLVWEYASWPRSDTKSQPRKTFTLLVHLKFQDVASLQEFGILFHDMATYVRDFEPTTVSYQLLVDKEESLERLLLERYVSKQAYLEIHKVSTHFLQIFRPKLQAIQDAQRVTLTGSSWEDGLGFGDRC